MKSKDDEILSDSVIRSPHKKRKNLSMRKKDNLNEGVKIWCTYFRKNLHRFAIDYLGLDLFPFQMIMLYLMNIMYSTCFICARGLSKSYTTAIFLVCRAILFPNQLLIVSCVTKQQARNLIEGKIVKELMVKSPTLRQEIAYNGVKLSANECSISFKNGSVVTAINASDNQRGRRCHILVVVCLPRYEYKRNKSYL